MLSFSKHLTYLYVCVNYTAGNGGCQERKEAVLKRQPLFEFVGVARERPAKYLYDVSSNLNRKPHIC